MFNLFKKKEDPKPTLRDTLFGDMPMSKWPEGETATGEPWTLFIEARNQLDKKDKNAAIATLQRITDLSDLEPRHYLQAWHFLRSLGVNPPADKAKIAYGVVIEVGMEKGADIVAAYTDFNAYYVNFTGAATIWQHPDNSLDAEIDALLKAGQMVAEKIGPWDKARPAPPTNGNVRLNMLTPSGLHFGEGGFNVLSQDPMGKALIDPATALMLRLTKLPR
ncbi:MAG: hypothetical protein KJZ77_07235 [Anaerolineales bacterium]|nr:hypothetical protein [Anaerolineales bacterium]